MSTELGLLLLPFAAGLLVLCSHLVLGEQVLRRGILFIDLAVAQLAALGSLLVQQWWPDNRWVAGLGGLLLAVIGTLLISWLVRRFPQQREAAIGLIYAVAASVLLLLLVADPHAGHRLARSLNGDILWVGGADLLPLLAATLALLVALVLRPQWLSGALFYPCFAVLVSLSVPLLGVFLVFVTLIAPALVARVWACRWMGGLTGGLGYASGLMLAWWQDWPAGPTLVLSLVCAALMLLALRPRIHSGGSSGIS